MDVYFANDVDTVSANPQELIQTLPSEARFATGTNQFWLANPDTPEGYRYYKAQVEALLAAYPQITWLVLWFRVGHTPWMEMKVRGHARRLAARVSRPRLRKTPEAEKFWHAPQIFAMGKIVRAFDRALKDLGQQDVQLAAGTWRFDFVPPAIVSSRRTSS